MLFFEELIKLSEISNLEEWFKTLKQLSEKLGYSQLLFGLKPGLDTHNKSATILSNYPEKWRKTYDDKNYADIDPVVSHSFKSNLPLIWKEEIYTGTRELEFLEEASSYDLLQGVTLPMHGSQGQAGMLSLKWDSTHKTDYQEHVQVTLPYAIALRDFALESAIGILAKENQSKIHLTKRELEVIKWSAAGKTTWEISIILACSYAAIDFHFRNIRKKFKVNTRRQAIIKAIQLKLITP
ncbi:LuxR family transcriptional regulator [Pseudomonas cucumis]|uniref:LuxR family transcriptional regulator n=1 Tax=Pseudomonas cucumis TaxID=2954082 RepID=A0ABY9EYR7_9PSED|nr:LuxR family transcriptional regulator [Pseudomonas cucumis]WLG85683.1 LuxR family transcriptional regulator [Pseudomonas cucumis]